MLEEEKIKAFQKALQGKPPAWDPNWEITQQLLKLVTIQTEQLINLQAQLDALAYSNCASYEVLLHNLRQSMQKHANFKPLSPQKVDKALEHLNASVDAVNQDKHVADYAGYVLKFMAMLLI